MATGITGREKHGRDALTASRPARMDPHPLPEADGAIVLEYGNRLDKREVLTPVQSSFVEIDGSGTIGNAAGIESNAFVLADNLFALHEIIQGDKRATLVYLDPPYGTGMEFLSRELSHAYKDNRAPAAYLEFMRRRLILIREAMADDGSLYLHIGHQMLFHIKVILDEVFGPSNFRNMIVRRKCSSKNFTRKSYPNLNDYILFYTKSAKYKWNQPSERPDEQWLSKEYPKEDVRGRYKLVPVHAPGTRHGETGNPWRGMMPPPGKHWQYPPSRLDELDAQGEIHWSRNGNPRRKVYLISEKTLPLTDYWAKFRDAHHQSIKITGYPTEKNLDMMRVIVGASTNPGDLVMDPFCGSGTTIHAAHNLERSWIGIDESFTAARATLTRLRHGLDVMGDYVKRVPSSGSEHQLRLFQQRASRSRPTEPGTGGRVQSPSTTNFRFLVDSELLESHEKELRDIATL